MAKERVRVYVADDHPVYREGIVRAIKAWPEFELVGDSADGRQALEEIRALTPDVAVLDQGMPGLDGTAILNAIQRDELVTRVVLLSATVDSRVVYQATAGGVGAFISKESTRQRICETIARVARGETVISEEVQAGLANEIRLRAKDDRPALTPREREVLVLTADGRSGPEIARHLHLSAATVKSHMQNMYEKLGVSDRAAAVAEAMRRGLLE
ncbi:MAG: two-component system, NarL family, nitrate/nitrite response regulator NarL [Baekduia sp.]|nr:two-component system, NarL family, nitrate/nitrite response regulator NarL [Baekduia sp.]